MTIKTTSFELATKGHTDIIDITENVQRAVSDAGMAEGQVQVFVAGSTAGITSIEYEPGLLKDLPQAFEKFAPTGVTYHHDATWGDGNGYAHVRAAMLGPSFVAPFKEGRLILGTWQQIVLIDFDNRSRQRKIIVQIIGEEFEK